MKRAQDWEGNLALFLCEYNYQPNLTPKLDALRPDDSFDQSLINEIVLWKVNRYALLKEDVLEQLNKLTNVTLENRGDAEPTLRSLLGESGIDLPMASTLMRFRNPNTFQIIDRHAYRAVTGDDYPLHSASSQDRKVEVYSKYLDKLVALAESKKLTFAKLDRILYIFDKQENGAL